MFSVPRSPSAILSVYLLMCLFRTKTALKWIGRVTKSIYESTSSGGEP